MSEQITNYEQKQNANRANRFLHSFRYKNMLKIASLIKRKEKDKVLKVLDLGSGISKSYAVLKQAGFLIEYHAVEQVPKFYNRANFLHGSNSDFFMHAESAEMWIDRFDGFDLILAQEAFEHMPPLLVTRIIDSIARSNFGILLVTVPVEIGPALLIKNFGSFLLGYSRGTNEYTWRETLSASFYNLDNIRKHSCGHRGFDWRWLSHLLRVNLQIEKTIKSPFQFIPLFLAPSVGFVCTKSIESN